jgi:Mg2+/Co2+ transporter CorC
MPVEDAAAFVGTTWETTAATVNGLVTEALGHLPTPRERVTIGDFECLVEDVHRRTVVTVVARRIKAARREAGEEEEEEKA